MSMLETLFYILIPQGWVFNTAAVLLALTLDFLMGDPKRLNDKFSHPIVWIGALITRLEAILTPSGQQTNRQLFMGAILTVLILLICLLAGVLITWLSHLSGYGWIMVGVVGVIGSVLLAGRSLHDHVSRVGQHLSCDLVAARMAVGHIVGRDPDQLDEAGVGRAALESLAENFSDGMVAPVFWFLIGGLPGLLGYKAINTLDSMIGHRSEKYLYFGRVAARLDDVVNWLPARLTGGLFCLAALLLPTASFKGAVRSMMADASKHTSPNAGWQEAALAGGLGLALAGPRTYGGKLIDGVWMGDGNAQVTADDITRGCALYRLACFLVFVIVGSILLIGIST